MIKYRLFETYPGSLPLGSISKLDYSAYPKNWEAFVEKEYEIISLKANSGAILTYKKEKCIHRTDFDYLVEKTHNLSRALSNGTKIHSIERLIDGKVFTVKDIVKGPSSNNIFTIESFNVSSKGVAYASCSSDLYSPSIAINYLQKVEKVLYTTYDNVDRYEYQVEHWVINNHYAYSLMTCDTHFELCLKEIPGVYKLFSTEKAALEYVESFKPKLLFKTEDEVDVFVGDSYWCVNTAPHLWSIWEQTSGPRTELAKSVRAFSTEILAREYIKMNKPEFSRNQVLKVLEGLTQTRKNIVINYTIIKTTDEKN